MGLVCIPIELNVDVVKLAEKTVVIENNKIIPCTTLLP